jgi:hypothetical protein
MKLTEALEGLAALPEMEATLDALMPRVVEAHRTVNNICRCCPVALYLQDKMHIGMYVGFTSARAFLNQYDNARLPERVHEYIINSTSILLDRCNRSLP